MVEQATLQAAVYNRQLSMLEFFLRGRIKALNLTKSERPAEQGCDMAIGELQAILDTVIPDMRKA